MRSQATASRHGRAVVPSRGSVGPRQRFAMFPELVSNPDTMHKPACGVTRSVAEIGQSGRNRHRARPHSQCIQGRHNGRPLGSTTPQGWRRCSLQGAGDLRPTAEHARPRCWTSSAPPAEAKPGAGWRCFRPWGRPFCAPGTKACMTNSMDNVLYWFARPSSGLRLCGVNGRELTGLPPGSRLFPLRCFD